MVGLVAVGAYGAGAANLAHVMMLGGSSEPAPAKILIASAAVPAASVPDVNRAPKFDRAPLRQPIVGGLMDTAALFAPATALPDGAFVLPAAMVATIAPVAAQPATQVASIDKPAAATAAAVAKVDPTVTATVARTPGQVPLPTLAPAAPVLLAYASPKEVEKVAPFNAVISDKPKFVLDPNIDANHAWLNTPIPDALKSAKETKCLAEAIYFEARSEIEKGQLAVAQVVLNRVKNPTYPKTICDVVYQNSSYLNACQFSFACDGLPETITEQDAWNTAMTLAKKELSDEKTMFLAEVGAATHYHATYVRPDWASEMQRMDKIGTHVFYKTYNGGWN